MDEIIAALESLENAGSFCTKITTSLDNFDIKCNKVGHLEYPLNEDQIKSLIKVAKPAKFGWRDQTILDQSVRKVWEISKNKIKIEKRQWRLKFEPVLAKIKKKLGLPNRTTLSAELHNMLIYEAGNFFKPHQDSEKKEGMIATLVVTLPSQYEGGALAVDHNGVKKVYKFNASQLNKLSCIAFYADCYHEVNKVVSGYRVTLTYNLLLHGYKGSLESLYEPDFFTKVEKAFKNYFSINNSQTVNDRKPLKVVYLLDHQYTQKGLSWDRLKNADRVRVDALLKVADNLQLDAYLALADMQETWDCEIDYHSYSYRGQRHYYEDEDDEFDTDDDEDNIPTDIICTEVILKYWIDRKGRRVKNNEFSPGYDEVFWTGTNDNFKPFESEYEPWMGNYGNTLDRWYHRAAIVLWRKEDHYPVLFEVDQSSFVDKLFSLIKLKGNHNKVQEMLQNTVKYWRNYAILHKSSADITKILKLALYLNDSSISTNLLITYDFSFFNLSTLKLWLKLIDQYGYQWCLDIFETVTNKEGELRYNDMIINNFPDIIKILVTREGYRQVVNWLIDYQKQVLNTRHKYQRNDKPLYRDAALKRCYEVVDCILATILAGDKNTHLRIVKDIINDKKVYPPLFLVETLEKCLPSLTEPMLESWGYQCLFNYIYTALTNELKLGLRSKENWRIDEQSACDCTDCKALNQFLITHDVRHKIWPLVEHRRDHIQAQITTLAIPLSSKIEKTGRPYKLILTKTPDLYNAAKKRYAAIQQAVQKLNVVFSEMRLFNHELT